MLLIGDSIPLSQKWRVPSITAAMRVVLYVQRAFMEMAESPSMDNASLSESFLTCLEIYASYLQISAWH